MRCFALAALLTSLPCLAAEPNDLKTSVKKDSAALEGDWLLESLSINGEEQEVDWGKRRPIWRFEGDKLTTFTERQDKETVRFDVDPTKKPKHLDLIRRADRESYVTKGIYSLHGDKLKVSFTFMFSPGSPKQELEAAREAGKRRPENFDAKAQDVPQFVMKFRRLHGESKK